LQEKAKVVVDYRTGDPGDVLEQIQTAGGQAIGGSIVPFVDGGIAQYPVF
jgi:hypothetical protein